MLKKINNSRKSIIALAFLAIFVSQVSFFLSKICQGNQPAQPSVKGIEIKTTVSAQVGENYLYLSGYSSPFAQIFLTSSIGNLKRQTAADKSGFFLFQFVFLPQKTDELCLIAQDINGLPSPPLYLPELPANLDVNIENILMPPTLSLFPSKGEDDLYANGKTFPNSKVLVYLYAENETTFWEKLKEVIIKTVFAKTAPRLEVASDDSGEFEFSLPSVEPAEQKLFVASLAEQINLTAENYSPKSFTLTFQSYSIWEKITAFIILSVARLIIWLKTNPTNIIWLEIPIIFILIVKILLRGWIEKTLSEEAPTEILK